jgi:PAS domain S-box-containing protein
VGGGHQYTLAAVRDVTERKAAERAQHEVEERFRLLVESVETYAIFMLDPDGNVATWNIGAQRLKGYREEEILGRSSSTFYTPEDREAGKPRLILDTAAAVGRVEDFGWRVRKDGSRFQATVTITAILDEAGVLRGFAKVTRDVTDALRVRDEVERVRLLEQREQLGRDLHDGVIQSIFSVGMMLQSASLRIDDARTRQRIDRSVDELDRVIRDLRAFIFSLHNTSGTEMLRRELERLAADMRESAGLTIVMAIDEAALDHIAHAATDLVLVVKEALSNVARHSGARSCRVSVHVDGPVVVVEIDDDGRGFDPAAHRSGFGLTNMQSRAAAIQGAYRLTTGPGGTTVQIRVPAT